MAMATVPKARKPAKPINCSAVLAATEVSPMLKAMIISTIISMPKVSSAPGNIRET